jgi:hypothetical protein
VRHGRARATAAARTHGRSLSAATALSLAPTIAAVVGVALLVSGDSSLHDVGIGLLAAYGIALVLSGLRAALRFRSLAVGLLEPVAVVASQAAYVGGFVLGLTSRFSRTSPSSTFQSKRRA